MTPRASYGGRVPPAVGGVVASVDPGGPASRAAIVAGDVVVSADGVALRDIIDWQWASDGPTVSLCVRSGVPDTTRTVEVPRDLGESWGIEFADAVFDGVRTCANRCAFCFMTQLPKGLRKALYLRDDDFRLSFLQGNFVTLTNLSDSDVERIAEQQLSPLYVSLHAVEPEVREVLVCAAEDRALERFDQLLAEGIQLHAQIVLVPGVNDSTHLERTLAWLAEREGVLSVGVVPLGFTAHQDRFAASFSASDAAAVIAQITPWQEAFRQRDGISFVYLADEFYLLAGEDLPSAADYDDFPQYENGIGMVRTFIDEFRALRTEFASALATLPRGLSATIISGEMFAPVLSAELDCLGVARSPLRVLPVNNSFFGGNVAVTGLLTSRDILDAMVADAEADMFLVPDVVANADGLLLDDVPARDLGTTTGRDVRLISCDAGGLLAALEALVAAPPPIRKE